MCDGCGRRLDLGHRRPEPAGERRVAAPVVIGDLCSCTGPEASTISQTTDVVNAWASSVNAEGGLDGHKVQIVVKDDGYNPATSLADAQALVEQNHVIAIFDNSDEDAAWATYIEKAKVPVMGATEADTGYKNPDFFPPGGTFNYSNGAGAVAAHKAGIKTEAILYCAEVAICQESSARSQGPAAQARDEVGLFDEHRLRRTQLLGAVLGGQAVRCPVHGRGRRVRHRDQGGRELRDPGLQTDRAER